MKILIIANGMIGNQNGNYFINKHTVQFTKELIELKVNIGLLQFEEIIKENTGLQDDALDQNILIYSFFMRTRHMGKFISYIKMLFLMLKTIKQYDFVYIFYPGHVPVLASILSVFLGKKYGLYIRGQHNIETYIGKYIVKKAEFCLTVSDLLKAQLLKNNENCETIAPMIDFSKKDILLNRNYSSDGITRCLFVGRVEFRKGIFDLVEAIEILNTTRESLHFDIIGGGESFDELSQRFKNTDNIIFRGQVSEKDTLLKLYRKADLFIFPSHDEGFPRVLYEAMMARVPVVTTMVGGIGGFMKDHYNCLVIDAQNAESIVKVVENMLDDQELKMKLVEQATQDILKLFDGTRIKHSKLLIEELEKLK